MARRSKRQESPAYRALQREWWQLLQQPQPNWKALALLHQKMTEFETDAELPKGSAGKEKP